MFDMLEELISGLIRVFVKLFILFFVMFATIAMISFVIILIDLLQSRGIL